MKIVTKCKICHQDKIKWARCKSDYCNRPLETRVKIIELDTSGTHHDSARINPHH